MKQQVFEQVLMLNCMLVYIFFYKVWDMKAILFFVCYQYYNLHHLVIYVQGYMHTVTNKFWVILFAIQSSS